MASKRSTGGLPRMIRGSVLTQRRRCGKRGCRCADGVDLHEATVLSYSESGRSRTVMLAAGEVAAVRAATERYRAARARVRGDGEAGLQAWLSARATRRGR
ncbi:MAG TPA: DUF6788 family protein [Pseudonocardiaceae bacterium]